MIRIPDDHRVRRSVTLFILAIGIACTILRIVVVSFWSVTKGYILEESIVMELALTVLSDAILLSMIGLVILRIDKNRDGFSYEPVASSLTIYSVSSLALLVLAAIVPKDFEDGRLTTFIGVITSHVIAIGTFSIAIGLSGFLATILLRGRHKHTKPLLVVQVLLLMGIWFFSTLAVYGNAYNIVAIVLTALGGILMLVNTRRLHWLSTISMEKKVRLLWLTFCAVFASAVLSVMYIVSEDSFLSISASTFIRSGAVVPSAINFFGFVFFVRFLFAVIASLPNSGIVDRRSSEVESLAHITRLMSEAVSVDQLLQSTTDLAVRVCRAHGAWTEVIEGDTFRVAAAQLVHPEYVRVLHANPALHAIIAGCTGPVHIESLRDVANSIGDVAIRSMILVPIMNDKRKTGTLVVFSTIDYGFEVDDLRLLTAFGGMVSIAADQARLMESALNRERLQKEADVAREIQSSLLPKHGPDVLPFSVFSVMMPATEVGGDYYDYIRFLDGTYGVIIADVAGKGIPAALYMATLKGAVLAEMRVSHGPADLLRRVNETLMGSMERRSYISLTCVQFSTSHRSIRIARAGHTPAITRVSGQIDIIQPAGVAIGIVAPAVFNLAIEEREVKMNLGDMFLLTTDGVNERRNLQGEEIGMDAIAEMVRVSECTDATALVKNTIDLIEAHASGAEPHDDITIVGIVFTNYDVSQRETSSMESPT